MLDGSIVVLSLDLDKIGFIELGEIYIAVHMLVDRGQVNAIGSIDGLGINFAATNDEDFLFAIALRQGLID